MQNKQLMSDVDEYGFAKTEEENHMKANYYEILTRRALRWRKIFPDNEFKDGRQLQRFIRKGESLIYKSND